MIVWSSYRGCIGGRLWDVNRLALWRSLFSCALTQTTQRCVFCSTCHRKYSIEVWQLQGFPLGPHRRVWLSWPRYRRRGAPTSRRRICGPDIWVRAPRLGRTVPHGCCKESPSISITVYGLLDKHEVITYQQSNARRLQSRLYSQGNTRRAFSSEDLMCGYWVLISLKGQVIPFTILMPSAAKSWLIPERSH